MPDKLRQLIATRDAANVRAAAALDAVLALNESASADDLAIAETEEREAVTEAEAAQAAVSKREKIIESRARFEKAPEGSDDHAKRENDRAPRLEITRSEATYRPDSGTFFKDLIAVKSGDGEARERLMRNNAEYLGEMQKRLSADPSNRQLQQRAGLTQAAGAGGEFIAPVWYIDQTQMLLRAGRAFADQCSANPLPEYTNSINVPKITTGASTTVSADAAAVSNTDLVTTSVTAQVQTISGRTVAAYQDIDLGGPIVEQMIYQDLLADYWRTLDSSLLNGAVANAKGVLNVSGINAVTYTDASPTGPELYVPGTQAKNGIEKGAFAPAEFSLWHPSTWNWYLSQLDTANRPLALSVDSPMFNAFAKFNPEAQGVAGEFLGKPVVVDANLPVNLGAGTNESRIVFANRRTLVTYEGVPRFKVADQTSIANLQYQFVLYGYYAVAFPRQPKMISVVAGTGLIVQSGY